MQLEQMLPIIQGSNNKNSLASLRLLAEQLEKQDEKWASVTEAIEERLHELSNQEVLSNFSAEQLYQHVMGNLHKLSLGVSTTSSHLFHNNVDGAVREIEEVSTLMEATEVQINELQRRAAEKTVNTPPVTQA